MSKKILYAVLNWGLGHASRSIPIIKNILLDKNNDIIIASDGEALELLKKEFPNAIFESLIGYNAVYSKDAKKFDSTIFFQLNKFRKVIKAEHQQTKKLIEKHSISHIISDNRYGVYSSKIPSAIVCHQINLQHKNSFIQKQMNVVHLSLLNKFQEVWVPDFKGEKNISGKISTYQKPKSFFKSNDNSFQEKIKYLGLVSRMKKENLETKYKLCIILSGPEPQRTLLEKILLTQMVDYENNVVFVRGTNIFKEPIIESENLKVYNLIESEKLNEIINSSEIIICRAGYSSIMDLIQLNKNAILIPTPGQTEQEYLAEHLMEKKWFYSFPQSNFDLEKSLFEIKKNKLPTLKMEEKILQKILTDFVSD